MVHVSTGTMYNRHGVRLSIAGEFKQALEALKKLPFIWLDCEALERRHGIGQGTLIILDWIVEDELEYVHRRKLLSLMTEDAGFQPIAIGLEPLVPANDVRLVPAHEVAQGPKMWEVMQTINTRLACTFYEGVVAKRGDSLYPIQLRSPDEEFAGWYKHRFTTK